MLSGAKHQTGMLDGTPEKRLFWSIISDYDTASALCELVDNAVDRWWPSSATVSLRVDLQLDIERQLIVVEDNAGGVAEEDLRYLIAPGGSNNDPDASTIGVFGVGSKRAAIALAENVAIRTRRGSEPTFQIDVTKGWVESPDWDIPLYRVTDIRENTTHVEMSALRRPLTKALVHDFEEHLGLVYSKFLLSGKLELVLNGRTVAPITLDQWAYPKKQEPRRVAFDIDLPGEGLVSVTITAGLIYERDPSGENYGVCFYCNRRLISRHLKTREVGYYVGSGGGVPHPDASLARVVVELEGPARLMPWTSSKTGINYSHPIFKELFPLLLPLLNHFSSLSRRLKQVWETSVFNQKTGEIVDIDNDEAVQGGKVHMPPLPRVHKTRGEQLVGLNKKTIEDQPWTLGLVEGIAMVDVVARQPLQTRNRIALILLDSNFEIALKEYIVHRPDLFPPGKYGDTALRELFKNRENVIAEVTQRANITPALLARARHYYAIRNKLIHERATVEVLDSDIRNYRVAVQQILQILFGLNLNA